VYCDCTLASGCIAHQHLVSTWELNRHMSVLRITGRGQRKPVSSPSTALLQVTFATGNRGRNVIYRSRRRAPPCGASVVFTCRDADLLGFIPVALLSVGGFASAVGPIPARQPRESKASTNSAERASHPVWALSRLASSSMCLILPHSHALEPSGSDFVGINGLHNLQQVRGIVRAGTPGEQYPVIAGRSLSSRRRQRSHQRLRAETAERADDLRQQIPDFQSHRAMCACSDGARSHRRWVA